MRLGQEGSTEIRALTSLRFFAAVAVFLEHMHTLPGLDWVRGCPVALGKCGVTLFFVLSGYIIALTYSSKDWPGDFGGNSRRFYWARVARIYPMHWFAFLLALPIGLASNSARVNVNDIPILWTLTEGLWPGAYASPQPVTAAWTLSCEVLFYLLSPLIFLSCRRAGRPAGVCFSLLIVYTVAIAWATSAYPDLNWRAYARVPDFLIGILAYFIFANRKLRRRSGFFVLGGLVMLLLATPIETSRWGVVSNLIPSMGAAALIVGIHAGSVVTERLLTGSLVVLLGHASYAFYLLHDPFLRYSRVLLNWLGIQFTGLIGVCAGITFMAVTAIAAILAYRWIEDPARRFLRGLADGSGPKRPKVTEEALNRTHVPRAASQIEKPVVF